ncbi:3-hydroxypropionyl-coenzyme A dehydratase [Chlamydiales bacterium SCGC AG-110-P3]|nr:3-hydroxypropionyl-coenzyme A dehydratase [Chlamydiales bacterium SCGC AG-110-P3]
MAEIEKTTLVVNEQPEKDITLLTLNRPNKRNALNIPILEALCTAITEAEASKQRVIILKGSGLVFCAGLDLSEAFDPDQAHKSAQTVAKTLRHLYYTPLVTIAAVHGSAIAGGAGLMSACDLAVASKGTRIGYPETRRGLVAGLVMSFLIRQVGDRAARELLLTAELIDATRALELGLLNRIVEEDKLLDTALEMARSVTKGAPHATAHSKQLLDTMHPPTVEQDIQLALNHHMQARNSPEAEEGIRAFLEKRDPSWK